MPGPIFRRPSIMTALWLCGAGLLWALYTVIFAILGQSAGLSAVHALANVLPLGLLAATVSVVLRAEVMQRSPLIQAAWNVGLAAAFTVTWYATLLLCLAVAAYTQGRGFDLSGFPPLALTWQLFQGIVLYAAIAAVCYATRAMAAPAIEAAASAPQHRPLTHYLIRTGDEMTPIEVDDIITVTGAQDYAEVATSRDRHLVRLSLSEFEARLDPNRFVRVHRSTIIHLGRLRRTEMAGGGRLLAHMCNGEVVNVSRSGAQALRRFVI